MDWTNDAVLEFLDLYENEPVIWMTKHADHKNRNAVSDGWRRIQDKISIQSSVQELKKKKESLMASYRNLVKKVEASSGTGSGSEEVFRPSWYAFEKMDSFLHYKCEHTNTQDIEELNLNNLTTVEDDDSEDVYEETKLFAPSDHTNDMSTENLNSISRAGPSYTTSASETQYKALIHTAKNQKRKAIDVVQKRMDGADKIFKTAVNTEKSKSSICQVYGQLVAAKLEALDEIDRTVVMHDIDNLLFRATLRHMEKQ